MGLESFLSRLLLRRGKPSDPSERGADRGGPRKWLPVIDTDSCNGCGLCLEACGPDCLELVWSFATLVRPHDCGSEGHCIDACPDDVIAMGWVPLRKACDTRDAGRWEDGPDAGLDDVAGAMS